HQLRRPPRQLSGRFVCHGRRGCVRTSLTRVAHHSNYRPPGGGLVRPKPDPRTDGITFGEVSPRKRIVHNHHTWSIANVTGPEHPTANQRNAHGPEVVVGHNTKVYLGKPRAGRR